MHTLYALLASSAEKDDKLPGRSTPTRPVERVRHEVPRFPAQEPAFCRFFRASLLCSGFIKNEFSRRRVTSLPHPPADRAKPFLAEQAAEPMGYLNYSESALLICNRLSEGAKRMSLPVYTASEQRKRVITSAPWACCLRGIDGKRCRTTG